MSLPSFKEDKVLVDKKTRNNIHGLCMLINNCIPQLLSYTDNDFYLLEKDVCESVLYAQELLYILQKHTFDGIPDRKED